MTSSSSDSHPGASSGPNRAAPNAASSASSASPSPTQRLYYDDPFLVEFRASVRALSELGGKPSIILDRTAFFPEGGGQMADRGRLAGLEVRDVQVTNDGALHHVVEGQLPSVGTEVAGSVDLARRRVHMALHTGQHILSRALLDIARAETVSARLGESSCTIDVDIGDIEERDIARAEDLANAVVDGDVAIHSFFPSPEELARLPLRREPKVEGAVRVIQIGDFDWTPCGGTHCVRSAQVGFIHVVGAERYKGGTRVTFGAGRRAREQLAGESAVLRALGKELSSGPRDIPAAVDKLRRELLATREELGQARARLAQRTADEIIAVARAEGHQMIVAQLEDTPVELLRAVAKRVTELPQAVAVLAGRDEDGAAVIVARGSASTFDCGAFLKRAAQSAGGRGGGRPERAEGRIPAGVDWPTIVRSLLDSK